MSREGDQSVYDFESSAVCANKSGEKKEEGEKKGEEKKGEEKNREKKKRKDVIALSYNGYRRVNYRLP